MKILTAGLLLLAPLANAQQAELQLKIKDHLFFPATLEIPAGQKVKVVITNNDPTAEEFESHSLNREKVIPGNSMTVIYIGPLEPGEYLFYGEYYARTAQGKVVVR
jgi:plastocyanin